MLYQLYNLSYWERIRQNKFNNSIHLLPIDWCDLSAIIYNLRHCYNWPISTRYGRNRIAYYRLGSDVDRESLEKPMICYDKKKGAATPSFEKSDTNNPKSEDSD